MRGAASGGIAAALSRRPLADSLADGSAVEDGVRGGGEHDGVFEIGEALDGPGVLGVGCGRRALFAQAVGDQHEEVDELRDPLGVGGQAVDCAAVQLVFAHHLAGEARPVLRETAQHAHVGAVGAGLADAERYGEGDLAARALGQFGGGFGDSRGRGVGVFGQLRVGRGPEREVARAVGVQPLFERRLAAHRFAVGFERVERRDGDRALGVR